MLWSLYGYRQIIIGEVKRVNTTNIRHRVPHERGRYVLNRRVAVLFELDEDFIDDVASA